MTEITLLKVFIPNSIDGFTSTLITAASVIYNLLSINVKETSLPNDVFDIDLKNIPKIGNTKVIAAFPACGKSYCFDRNEDYHSQKIYPLVLENPDKMHHK